jgi:hypothetical protein
MHGQVAVALVGRLAYQNPAYVLPSLRKTLIQLLTEVRGDGGGGGGTISDVCIGPLALCALGARSETGMEWGRLLLTVTSRKPIRPLS